MPRLATHESNDPALTSTAEEGSTSEGSEGSHEPAYFCSQEYLARAAPEVQKALKRPDVWNPFEDPFQTKDVLVEGRLDAIAMDHGVNARQEFIDSAHVIGRTNRWYRLHRAKLVELMSLQQLFRWYWDTKTVALLLSFMKSLVGQGINDHFTRLIMASYQISIKNKDPCWLPEWDSDDNLAFPSLFRSHLASKIGSEKLWASIISRAKVVRIVDPGGSNLLVEGSEHPRLLFSLNVQGKFNNKGPYGKASQYRSVFAPTWANYPEVELDCFSDIIDPDSIRARYPLEIPKRHDDLSSRHGVPQMTHLVSKCLDAIEVLNPDAVVGSPGLQLFELKNIDFLEWLEDWCDYDLTNSFLQELQDDWEEDCSHELIERVLLRQRTKMPS